MWLLLINGITRQGEIPLEFPSKEVMPLYIIRSCDKHLINHTSLASHPCTVLYPDPEQDLMGLGTRLHFMGPGARLRVLVL